MPNPAARPPRGKAAPPDNRGPTEQLQLTEEARAALAEARVAAAELGQRDAGPEHVLLGLLTGPPGVAGDALREAGLTAERVRARLDDPDGVIPAGRAAARRRALEGAAIAARLLGEPAVAPEHLLLGLARDREGPAVRVLAALGVPAGDLARRTLALHAARFPSLLPAPGPGVLAGRGGWMRACGLAVLLGAAALAALLAVAPDDLRLPALAVAALEVLLLAGAVSLAARRGVRRIRRQADRELEAGPLVDALAPAGVKALSLWVRAAGWGPGRALRVGGRAWIGLSPGVPARGAPFLLAHEAAHVARYDTLRQQVAYAVLAVLVVVQWVTQPSPLTIALVALALAVYAGARWWAEVACDRAALAWAGPDAARAWFDHVAAAVARTPRTPRTRIRRALGWVTHPPLRMRRRWLRI